MKKTLFRFIGSFGFVGYLPKSPGTFGSLAALIFIWYLDPAFYLLAMIVFFVLGCYVSNEIAKDLGSDDPQFIVIDEVVGMFLALLFIPLDVTTLWLGFVFFRLFDITKPFGIKKIEHLPHGFGIMLDDVLAGIYANICVRITLFFF